MFPECERWRDSPLTRSSIARSCGSPISSGVTIHGPERAEGVDRLAEGEDAGLHLAPLDVPRRDVVEDHVAADVVLRFLRAEPLAGLADHDGELELVVELLGQVLGVDDRIVRADDRVDVLEEDDPGRDLVRPADALRLLLVLAEVAGGVEELLRDDRRAQADVGERVLLTGRARNLVPLEQLAHRLRVELGDHVALDPADLSVVEGGQSHRGDPNQATTSAALRSGGNTG